MSDGAVEHRIWMRKDWWDPEPDRFSMQVHNSAGDHERFLVVSGNATWLRLEQAKEVRDYLDRCILNMETLGEAEPTAQEDPPPRTHARRKRRDTDKIASSQLSARELAQAWDDGWNTGWDQANIGPEPKLGDNPYRNKP